MNQILITEKLYVTPELKRKKKIYKFDFMLSIFIIIILISVAIYAEYDKNKSEEVSKSMLEDFNYDVKENIEKEKKNILEVVLGKNDFEDIEEDTQDVEESTKNVEEVKKINTENSKRLNVKKQANNISGYTYYPIATINIPKINVNYSIIEGKTQSEKETEVLLKKSPCKLAGPEPNMPGNFCVVGHNYRNTKFFSKVPTLKNGDIINITDLTGNMVTYSIYKSYIVNPYQIDCLKQNKDGKREITIITCTNDSKNRVIVKAREVK